MVSVPENNGLKIKASIIITWVIMPEIQTNVPRHQDQHVCYHRQMSETRPMCLESGPRFLKSRHMRTEIRVKMLKIKTNVYRDQGHAGNGYRDQPQCP